MALKCRLCGTEYIHDREICHKCEDKAIRSGLNIRGEQHHKWRCDTFLDSNGLIFGCNLEKGRTHSLKMIECPKCGVEYSYGRSICHTCEENSLPFGKIFKPVQRTYRWNCNTAMTCFELITSEVETIETIVTEQSHREELKRTDYKWNEISAINFNNTAIDRKKGLLIYE